MRCLTIALALFACLNCIAVPASKRNGARTLSIATRLVGEWHSTSVSGGVAAMEVDTVTVHFKDNGTFTATATLTIGGPDTFSGKYSARLDHLVLHPEGSDAITCQVIFKSPATMVVNAPSPGVTGHFTRGAAPKSSGGGWF